MARYSARIELHDAKSREDYNVLHKAMWKAGFRRVVASSDSKLYLLPTGSYITDTQDDLNTAYVKARGAADSTGKRYWIWFVRWDMGSFVLEEVAKDPDAP
jgi:hypothetical protein